MWHLCPGCPETIRGRFEEDLGRIRVEEESRGQEASPHPKDNGIWLRRCDSTLATSHGALKDLQIVYEDP